MGSLFAYSGLTTKLRAMQGRLLDDEDYMKLTGMASVAEIVSYLKGIQAYGEDFEGLDAANVHRDTLERILNFSKYRDFTSIYRFAGARQRRYLNLYFVRYETALFKKAIRNRGRGYDRDFSAKLSAFFANYSSVNVDELLKVSTIDELIDALAQMPSAAPYYRLFKKIALSGQTEAVDYELALDLHFFRYAWDKKERFFKKNDLKNFTMAIGTEIDTLNIIWIYRAKKYYKLTGEEIYSLIIPIHYKLRQGQMKKLIEASSRGEFIEALKDTVYGSQFVIIEDKNVNIERAYNLILDRLYNKFYRSDPYSLAAVNNYLYRKEMEIKKIITISECVRYKYPTDEIAAQIF